ncbi:hypothetical protein DERF_006560 [Dermatophagoides farinae]|uniref:Uncharacterized protein n=1 Tax=Dermatophagoides farinae TaxID=6954 RepID=A0A922I6E9_DERFA|nr:hypothetical protein DERF_006560 [Dermatophagoides farinae]
MEFVFYKFLWYTYQKISNVFIGTWKIQCLPALAKLAIVIRRLVFVFYSSDLFICAERTLIENQCDVNLLHDLHEENLSRL